MGVGTSLAPSNLPTENINVASMNVKVPTKKVIASLEKRLVEMKESNKKAEVAVKEYEAKNRAYEAAAKAFVPTGKPTLTHIRWGWGDDERREIEVQVHYQVKKSELPVRPVRPDVEQFDQHVIREVEGAIRILKMTDEETVSASTFKSVSQYL
jgi:galactokinase